MDSLTNSVVLHHLTLTTGHDRLSPKYEVDDESLTLLEPWLAMACSSEYEVSLPALEDYTAIAIVHGSGLVMTVYGPALGKITPLVTFAVAQESANGDELWNKFAERFGIVPGLNKPPEPWCGVVIHPGLAFNSEANEWLGDFERCIAWTWISHVSAKFLLDPS